jgi:hypothetical protein
MTTANSLASDASLPNGTGSRTLAMPSYEWIVAGFALAALLFVQWMLSSAIHGTNYDGSDGKMAQATILAAVKFSAPFQVTTMSPIEGLGSQLLPLNVWANPAFWPFHFLDKALATDISALIALMVFAIACYVMARCFDGGVIASAIAAQMCIVLFAPMVLVLQLPTVFCLTPGNAVAYAPHMVALGLLARLEPGSGRKISLITVGIFAMLFYSLCCDPLWTMVDGISWSVAFAVVVLSPMRLKTIALRCAALGGSAILLFLSGALEYLRTLSQYTARVQFPAVADRPRMVEFVSTLFVSPHAKYFYLACGFGWLVGMAASRGRPRVLCIAAAVSFLCYVAYSTIYLLLQNVPWMPPIPSYVEQCLLPLYLAAGVVGYSAVPQAVAQTWATVVGVFFNVSKSAIMVPRIRIAAVRRGRPWLANALVPLARLIDRKAAPRTEGGWVAAAQSRAGVAPVLAGVAVAAIIPACLANFARAGSAPYAEYWNEPWPKEPEVVEFFTSKVGRSVGQPIRGSLHFWTYNQDIGFTIISLWAKAVHTIDEYSQLVTPQALYSLHALLQNNVTGALNGFVPMPGTSWDTFFKTLQLFGVRYYIADPGGAAIADQAGYPAITLPRRPLIGEPGLWRIHELPRPNVGDYSPTEVVTAASAPEMVTAMRVANFDFTRQVVLSMMPREPLVPAQDVRLSPILGGLHLSGHSKGTSLLVLPQQFSNCLRARDERVRIVRADLFMTGVVFSGDIDTDILFDYGILTPGCRRGDLADMRRLRVEVDSRMPHLSGDHLFPDRSSILAKLRDAVRAIK